MSLTSSQPLPGGESIPRLAEPFEPTPTSEPRTTSPAADEKKHKKRGLFGFGKKKNDESSKQAPKSNPTSSPSALPSPPTTTHRTGTATTYTTATTSRSNTSTSPIQSEYPRFPSSPGRGGALSSSPRLSSPAGSQIFERDVQESTTLPTSPAIPAHIQTENYIPPVLDASSEAITDDHLNPDSVEIITHAQHQPASVTVTGVPSSFDAGGGTAHWVDELAAFTAQHGDMPVVDSASNYGSLENTVDVRRLSFISFADVVQAEQAGHAGMAGSRESMHLAGLTSLASVGINRNRSPSPIRSPVSSSTGGGAGALGTSPPTSKSGSVKGVEMSPSRKPLGSPTAVMPPHSGPTVSGELAIETMSQALRRTGSGDLSGARSIPTSPI